MAEVIRMPLLSDTMTEGKIISWNKKVGDKVKADDVLADVETDKATMEVNGYVDGTLLYIGVPAGEAAKINQIIAIVGKEGEDYKSLLDNEGSVTKTATIAKEQPTTNNEQPATNNGQRLKASPLAKKLAADKGIDISKVSGSGDGGRVTKKDIDSFVPTADNPQGSAGRQRATSNEQRETYTDVPLTQMRKTIARGNCPGRRAHPATFVSDESRGTHGSHLSVPRCRAWRTSRRGGQSLYRACAPRYRSTQYPIQPFL